MTLLTIGTCGLCLGAVKCPTLDGFTTLTALTVCENCGAKPYSTGMHGPTIIMGPPAPPVAKEPA